MSQHCDWAVYYNLMTDDGISLYNPKNQCNLATTFRSIPGPEIRSSNDTVLHVLDLKIEASCTISASEVSSRLFLIESMASEDLPRAANGALKERKSTIANVGFVWRAVEMLDARRRLGRFRRNHSHLQEEEIGLDINEIEGKARPFDLSRSEIIMCSLYLLVWMIGTLARQRFPDKAVPSLGGFEPGGLFVICHICCYYLLGMKMLHSSRTAGMVSMYCLTDYVAKMVHNKLSGVSRHS